VFFDDLNITHTKGKVLQEDHYYPFGMNISALSSTAPLSKPNNFKYNGFEEQTEFDLNWYDYEARQYDPQLGRFLSIDPAADAYFRSSPYSYALNNPIRFIDPDGMMVSGPPDVITKITNTDRSNPNYTTRDASITVTLKVVNSNGTDLSDTMFSGGSGTVDMTSAFGGRAVQSRLDGVHPDVQTNITQFNVEFEVVESLDDVGENDHVLVIADNIPDSEGDNTIGKAVLGGRASAVEAGTIKSGDFNEVVTHEIGHNLGLNHTRDGKGLMGKNVNGSKDVSITERGSVVQDSNVSPINNNGTYKASDSYKKNSETVTKEFLDRNKIK
jgi:RHS repeat-associated protein